MASPTHPHSPVSNEDETSRDESVENSAQNSAPGSRGVSRPSRGRQRVRFTPGGESLDSENHKSTFDVRDDTTAPPKPRPLPRMRSKTGYARSKSTSSIAREPSPKKSGDIADSTARAPVSKQRPSIMRLPSSDSDVGDEANISKEEIRQRDEDEEEGEGEGEDEGAAEKFFSQESAHQRAERLSRIMGSHSAPGSRYTSPVRPRQRSPPPSPPREEKTGPDLDFSHIPLQKLQSRRTYGIEDDTDEDIEKQGGDGASSNNIKRKPNRLYAAAARLVGHHTSKEKPKLFRVKAESPDTLQSGQTTPTYEQDPELYVPRPQEYREGVLSSIMKLYSEQGFGSALAHIPAGPEAINRAAHRRDSSGQSLLDSTATTPAQTPGGSPTSSGTTTPNQKHQKWYYKNPQSQSTGSIADLVGSSTVLAQPAGNSGSSKASAVRPKLKRKALSTQAIDTVFGKKKKGPKFDDSIRIKVHMDETIERQEYLLKSCRALMAYGAPTHRLEEHMRMSARVLEIDGQFLYIPGCMIISFDDRATHTTEVKIVRVAQGVNLGKLRDTHEVYKEVIHDTIGVQAAMQRLDVIRQSKDQYSPWVRVMVYGLASVCVGPFAFGSRPIDLPIAFFLGSLLGILQLVIAPHSELYSNIFEISAAVFTSFLARAFGSIRHGNLFCFSALAQSSIALILPGYTVLCGSLELQSRNIVAGSVRMVYAILYSLFLGFGITIGTAIYGAIDRDATSETVCLTTMPYWFKFIFVPPFTLCLIVINQGKCKQMPVMLVIAFAGYIVNYFSALRFPSNGEIANALGALAIGVMGNLYSRLRHGLAAAALLPAIFVQVPSGLAASGSLISGITSANQLTNHTANGGIANGTTTVSNGTTSGVDVNSAVLNVGYSMIQIAIGITVGLFLSSLLLYPLGKKRSGLFSF